MGTQGDFVSIKSKADIEIKLPFILKRIENWDFTTPLVVKLEKYENPRSTSQNALSHMWYKQISVEMAKKGHKVEYGKPEEVWKLFLKQRFLGVESYSIGEKVNITDQIKSTSKLTKGEMVHFLDNVYHWAESQKIILIIPADSEYAELLNQQER
tara:strand:+ start:612 stop:1076 length:465 start_codon:yes stop_codon:yes gene_type:complete